MLDTEMDWAYIVFMTNGNAATETTNTGASMSNQNVPVAEITLYGTTRIGAGWLARVYVDVNRPAWSNGLIGSGEPQDGLGFTEAVWAALDAIRAAGVQAGIVHVYEPTGRRYAEVRLDGVATWFGDLVWREGANVYVIPAADLAAAAVR
jgi:hypothetical protein